MTRQLKAKGLKLTPQRLAIIPHMFVLAGMFISREEVETHGGRMVYLVKDRAAKELHAVLMRVYEGYRFCYDHPGLS
jgi:hypothetical protein